MYYNADEGITVEILNLPTSIKGLVRENADSTYTILLNAKCSKVQQERTYQHELHHIKNGDFQSVATADLIESIS